MKTIGVIGIGLIGGSAALCLKNKGYHLIGFDQNDKHLETALSIGLIDEIGELGNYNGIDVLIVAIPVDAAKLVLSDILNSVEQHTTVLDMGSTKSGICKSVETHQNRSQFVAAHPIAGTENSGPEAAIPDLFEGKVNIICDADKSGSEHLSSAETLFEALGLRCLQMNPEEHDRHIAFVSHLSHISSFVLGQTVLEIEEDEKNIFNMAGSGFASTVRLAKSSPQMWGPIFQQNKPALLEALEAYINNLQDFKKNIENEDQEALIKTMSDVNRIRNVLEGLKA